MRKFKRLDPPPFLAERCEEWGRGWAERQAADPGTRFYWHTLEGELVSRRLLSDLKAQVQDHCSFCDIYPVSPPSDDTIEHFRPKAMFPREAYNWENLYYCCRFCQIKGGAFDEAVLRPDADDYSFERYFRWDFTTGELLVNEQASEKDRTRAEITRKFYRLNEKHPGLRLRESFKRQRQREAPLDDFAYRDFLI